MANVYNGNDPYVFISYAHKDSDKVIPILNELQKRRIRLWYDSGIEVGTEWPEYIANSLSKAKCVLAFISENAQASPNCRRELTYSINAGKEVLVVYLEECELSPGMQLQLGTLHAIFRTRHPSMDSFMGSLCKAECLIPCLEPEEEHDVEPSHTLEHLMQQALQGDASCQYELGLKYLSGDEVPQNENEAIIWISAAAKQNHAPAQYQLARCYYRGIGLPESCTEALRFYRMAAEQNNPKAEYAMYLFCKMGIGTERNRGEALVWCNRAAEHGNPSAQYYVGEYLMDQAFDIKSKNADQAEAIRTEAIRWFTMAAEQGDVHAQYAAYIHSRDKMDLKWCKLAAEQGHLEAQKQMAKCYETGYGVSTSQAEAFKWYKLAAEQGECIAQYSLGKFYYDGIHVKKDLEQAALWFAKAANNGFERAKQYLDICCI